MIGSITVDGNYFSGGIAYAALPADIDRDLYLKDCYMNRRISIAMEDGAFINRVPISIGNLGQTSFPLTTKELGSKLIYILDESKNYPLVVDVVSDDVDELIEGQLKISKKHNSQTIDLIFDARHNNATLALHHSNDKPAELNMFVKDRDGRAKLNVEVDGEIKQIVPTYVIGTNDFVIKNLDEENTLVQISKEVGSFNLDRISINNSSNSVTLNKETVSLFTKILNLLASTTVLVNNVPTPLSTALSFAQMTTQIDIGSKTLFSD